MHKTVVLNVVGLTPSMLGDVDAALSAWARGRDGAHQAGVPRRHVHGAIGLPHRRYPEPTASSATAGIRARTAEIRFWKQSNRLVARRRRSGTRRARRDPSFTCANLFWWFNMYSTAD